MSITKVSSHVQKNITYEQNIQMTDKIVSK